VPVPPNRGLIVDRNGCARRNYSGYTLEISRAAKSVEGAIDELSELIEITRATADCSRSCGGDAHAESLRSALASATRSGQVPANRYRFEGVEIKGRLFRQYPYGDVASMSSLHGPHRPGRQGAPRGNGSTRITAARITSQGGVEATTSTSCTAPLLRARRDRRRGRSNAARRARPRSRAITSRSRST